MNKAPQHMSTPCLLICELEPDAKICTGCGRSMKEIASWSRLSEPERLDIMAGLPARLETLRKEPGADKTFKKDV